MTKQLDLTEVQQHELKELLEGERDQEARLRTQPSLSPIQRTDRLRALRERNVSRFEEILTTEQRRRYEEFRAEAGGFLPTKSD